MSNEKDTFQNHEQGFNAERLKDAGNDQREKLASERERDAEKSKEASVEDARHEALEHASAAKLEHEAKHETHHESPAEKRGVISKRERNASYEATMTEVRTQMSAPNRVFSSIIHQPAVERISDTVGGTIARPNAVLSGSVSAFLLTMAIYLVARHYGYALSGTEPLAAFILGWHLGIAIDSLPLIVTGKT
jgi:hypothetical protein